MMTPALDRIGAPAVLLAPSADASRDSLRKEGFEDANTVASFLGDSAAAKAMREQVAGGGIIYVDEASMLSSRIWTGSAAWPRNSMPASAFKAIRRSIARWIVTATCCACSSRTRACRWPS